MSWTEVLTYKSLFQKRFILRRPSIAIFAHIIKIVTIFIRQSLKTQEKLSVRKYGPK